MIYCKYYGMAVPSKGLLYQSGSEVGAMFEGMDIFVYSGTGNTYKAAECIGRTADDMGIRCGISMIDTGSKPKAYQPSGNRLLGLMAPTIGAIQPLSFFYFILRLPKGNGQKVFLAATGAWTKIGPLYIPGYVGFGLYLAALIMLAKGYRVVGITGFGMSQNWTTLLPPYSKKLEDRINKEIQMTASDFSTDILSGKRIFRRITDLIVTLLIFPLPVLFILFGHLFLAKTMFAGSSCNGCGQCAAGCPRKAIRMYGKKNKRPYWTYRCEQCMRCSGYCPRKAVDCNTFLVLSYAVLFSAAPVELILITILNRIFAGYSINRVVLFVVYYIVILLLGAIIYAIFHLLSRIPPVNKLFTRLSFTHYWRKYRNSNVELKELSKTQPPSSTGITKLNAD